MIIEVDHNNNEVRFLPREQEGSDLPKYTIVNKVKNTHECQDILDQFLSFILEFQVDGIRLDSISEDNKKTVNEWQTVDLRRPIPADTLGIDRPAAVVPRAVSGGFRSGFRGRLGPNFPAVERRKMITTKELIAMLQTVDPKGDRQVIPNFY